MTTIWQADVTRLNERIASLERELGEARGALAERRPSDYWVRLVIMLIIGLLIVGLLAVVFLAGRVK